MEERNSNISSINGETNTEQTQTINSSKVTFDKDINDNKQSSLRRHKKNIVNASKPWNVEQQSARLPLPIPIRSRFTVIAKSNATIKQQMKLRGQTMVEEKKFLETPVKLEFNIDRTIVEYNVQEQLVILLKLMQETDPTLKIKSTTTETTSWDQWETLPEDETFNNHFQVKDFLYRKLRKVVVYMTLITRLHVNQIKYQTTVKEHLFQNNIWFKPDMFQTKVESSPGVMLMVHPRLTNRTQLTEDLKILLQNTATKLQLNHTEKNSTTHHNATNEVTKNRKVPQFYLEVSVKKWRDLKVEVIKINCAKDDAEYVKYLLSSSGEQGSLRKGVFLPEGLHLMEGKDLVYNMLQEHDSFMTNVTSIPVSGITYGDLATVVPNKSKSIKNIIMNIPGVITIEKSRDRDQTNTLLVITTKSNEQSVLEKLAPKMETFYTCQTGQKRIIMAGRQTVPHPGEQVNSVKTYAEILSARYLTTKQLRRSPSTTKPAAAKPSTNKSVQTNSFESKDQIKKQDTSTITTNLEKKLEEMVAKQEKMEHAQQKLQNEHNKLKNTDDSKHSQADIEIQEDKVNQLMDKKFAQFKEEQRKQMETTEESLRSSIGRSFDQKMDRISVTVAQQVTSQSVELFKQYMSPTKQIETNISNRERTTPLITQDVCTVPISTQSPTQAPTAGKHDDTHNSDNDSMLQALHAIDIQPTIPNSPHDNLTERNQMYQDG